MKSRLILLAISYAAFVSLGLPDTLIGVAWPSVRDAFQLHQSHASWIFVGSGFSYFTSSFFAGRLLKLFNVGVLLAGSSALVALSGFNFGVATNWPWFALGALLHGLGSGAIDSGLNHYVATHFSARHMNWLHASYSAGAMLGPAIMTACIARAGGWRLAYLIVALTLFILAVLFLATRSRWKDSVRASQTQSTISGAPVVSAEFGHDLSHLPRAESAASSSKPPTTAAALKHSVVQLNIVLFFIYTGVELGIGQWSFTVLTESRGIEPETAGVWVTIYWASILAGRVQFGFVVDRINIDLLIRLSLCLVVLGAAFFAANTSFQITPLALALWGLGMAVIFPCLMTRTPQRVGKDLGAHAIGFQVGAAMLGAAAVPSACGLIAQHAGLQWIPAMLLILSTILLLLHEALLLTDRRNKLPIRH